VEKKITNNLESKKRKGVRKIVTILLFFNFKRYYFLIVSRK